MGFNAPRISIQVHQLLTYNYDWCNNLGEITQQTNLAFTAEEAAAEQAWISSLLPEALTRRT